MRRRAQASMKPKTQSLSFVNGYAIPRDSDGEVDVFDANAFADAPARGEAKAYAPEYVKLHGLVLRFNAYFDETVENGQKESVRCRKCVIYFFLEDGSIKITEPRVENSGMPQGAFLKRHVVRGVTLGDLNVGKAVTIYGFEFKIYRCDGFTRDYLGRVGVDVPNDEREPDGVGPSWEEVRLARRAARSTKKDARGKFLTHDKQVLRFYCVWDDRLKFGDRRRFVLTFFLIDDTVAITEVEANKSGRGSGMSSTLLHRSRLPLRDEDANARGLANDDFDYVTAEDLHVGDTIRVYKRDFFIYGCDEFTKSWYLTKFPGELTEAAFEPHDVTEPEDTVPAHHIPEHTGLAIGSEEDSLQNCISLIPKPPRKDVAKDDEIVLQFRAEMVPISDADEVCEFDASRRFVVSFHVGDKTLSIFEQASKDSCSSKFLERARVRKRDETGAFYDLRDMRVGSVLEIHSRAFKLGESDEFTRKYLENAV